MGDFSRIKQETLSILELETLSILDSEHIDAEGLHNLICSVFYPSTTLGFLGEMPEIKAEKSYKQFRSAASAVNYIKEPIVGRYRCFWEKISAPMRVEPFNFMLSPQGAKMLYEMYEKGKAEWLASEPFAFVLFAPIPLPLFYLLECLVRTEESVWEVFRFTPVDE